jgi:ABC-type glutathione transport system ATPase component
MTDFEISVEGLIKEFGLGRRRKIAVAGVTMKAMSSRSLGIVGESGSGKSTLARMLVGLIAPTKGSIHVDGQPLSIALGLRADVVKFRRQVQFIAQDTTSTFDPRRTLRDAILGPLTQLTDLDRAGREERVDETLAMVRVDPALALRYPAEVSGGQRQRMAIARALVVRPRLLVCDEIVSALDVSIQGSILNMLKGYVQTHDAGLVFVSHGLPATAFLTDELLVMHRGQVVETGPTRRVLADPVEPYTRSLVAAHRSPSTDHDTVGPVGSATRLVPEGIA